MPQAFPEEFRRDVVAEELNSRPRRILDWQTPSEVLIASGAMTA